MRYSTNSGKSRARATSRRRLTTSSGSPERDRCIDIDCDGLVLDGCNPSHLTLVVLPARIIKPRDKAKVEVAVQIVERFVLAKLRNQRFFSLAELNAAIRVCVATNNSNAAIVIGQVLIGPVDPGS